MDNGKTSILLSLPPHTRLSEGGAAVYADALLALAPAAALAVIACGIRALALLVICGACAFGLSILLSLLTRKGGVEEALYACLSGILCAMFFGAGCALWAAALSGAVCALAVFWAALQGRRTVFQPALIACLLALVLFPAEAAAYTEPLETFRGFFSFAVRPSVLSPAAALAAGDTVSPLSLLLGTGGGMLGASNPLALLIGLGYLCLRRIGNLRAPAFAVCAMLLLSLFFPVGRDGLAYAVSMLLSGAFPIGLCFFLCPLCGAPMSRRGQRLFGLGFGILCFLIRRLFAADGTIAALLFMQSFTLALDSSLRAQTVHASRFFARLEALMMRGANTRRESARRSDAGRGETPPEPPAQEPADEPVYSAGPEIPPGPDALIEEDIPEEYIPEEYISEEFLTEEYGPEAYPDEPEADDAADGFRPETPAADILPQEKDGEEEDDGQRI